MQYVAAETGWCLTENGGGVQFQESASPQRVFGGDAGHVHTYGESVFVVDCAD